jgi:adenine-specific DNA glycosylase
MEPWLWQMEFHIKNGRIALVQTNNGTPWLKNSWVLPGRAEKMASTKVPDHDFQHAITHHKIFVKVSTPKTAAALKKINKSFGPDLRWVSIKQLEKLGVSSVVHKVLSLEPVSKKI